MVHNTLVCTNENLCLFTVLASHRTNDMVAVLEEALSHSLMIRLLLNGTSQQDNAQLFHMEPWKLSYLDDAQE